MLKLIVPAVLATCSFHPLLAQQPELINAAALQSGSFMRQTPPSYSPTNLLSGSVGNYTPEAIVDLSPKLWCSESGASFPHVFVVELTEPFIVEQIGFVNVNEEYEGISAKDVRIEVATDLDDPVWRSIGEFILPEGEETRFTVYHVEARLIRLSILSNYGHSSYTELAEFAVLGKPAQPEIRPVNVEGEWQTNWGPVRFLQSGTSVNGDYDYHDGEILYGGIDRNRITYKWVEESVGLDGWTLLFMNAEGTRLTGVWCHRSDWSDYGFWIMERETGRPFDPIVDAGGPNPGVPAEAHTVSEEVVERMDETITRDEKLVLYGINFATNSAEITGESFNVLDHLARLMEKRPGLHVRIEGHTDNVGSSESNLELSLARATSVRDYLVKSHGIDGGRIAVDGLGEGKPVADNETEAGRGANRRVEVHQIRDEG